MKLSDLRADLTQVDNVNFVGEVYPRRHLSLLASAPGTGKTWLVLQHSLDITCGLHLTCGGDIPDTMEEPYKVVIFCGEAGEGIMAERLRKLGMTTPPHNLAVYTLSAFMRNNVPIALDTTEGMNNLRSIVVGERPDVVFIDTLISFRTEDECDQKSTATMLGGLRHIAEESNSAFVLTHHLRKRKAREQGLAITQDDIIGTSAFTRLCSIAYTLSAIQFSDSVEFSCVKSWWRKPPRRAFRIESTSQGVSINEVEYEDDSSFITKAEREIASVVRGATITLSQLMERTGCSASVASRAVKKAVEDKVLRFIWQDHNEKFFQRL